MSGLILYWKQGIKQHLPNPDLPVTQPVIIPAECLLLNTSVQFKVLMSDNQGTNCLCVLLRIYKYFKVIQALLRLEKAMYSAWWSRNFGYNNRLKPIIMLIALFKRNLVQQDVYLLVIVG